MKNFVCFLFLNLMSLCGYCQPIVVQDDRQDVCYVGFDNHLTIVVGNIPTHAVSVSTDNGTIKGKNGDYILRADSIGSVNLYVKWTTPKGVKQKYTYKLRAEHIPDPFITLSGKTEGTMSAALARAQIAPSANIIYVGVCAQYTIVSFTFMIIRDNKTFFMKHLRNVNGVRFSDDTDVADAIKTLIAEDKIVFLDVICRGYNEKDIPLKPMQLTLIR